MRTRKKAPRTIMPDTIVPPPPSNSSCYTDTDRAVMSRRSFRQHIIIPAIVYDQSGYSRTIKDHVYSIPAYQLGLLAFAAAFVSFVSLYFIFYPG